MFQFEIDAKEVEDALPDYKYVRKIGEGVFATVHLVQKRETSQKYALKKISCFGMDQYQKNGAVNQVRLLSSFDHKNIIKVSSCLFDNTMDIVYIFMEYAELGDLTFLIQQAKQKKKRIPESTIWKIIGDISDGLCYLHKKQIIHRDLKPANIFRADKNYKIGDMNISRILKVGQAAMTKAGSPFYTAPQVWQESGYNNKCDMWSLGVLIFELCSLQVPFEGNSIFQISNKIKNGKRKNLPTFYSKTLNELFLKLLEIDHEKRLSSEQVYCIATDKLKIQIMSQSEKVDDFMLDTIVFPETNQRWINLIPSNLPPKTSRRQISISSYVQQKSGKSRQKFEHEIKENLSGIIRSNERKQIFMVKNKSRSKLQKNSENRSIVLPPLCKNSPMVTKKKIDSKGSISKEKKRNLSKIINHNSSISFQNQNSSIIANLDIF